MTTVIAFCFSVSGLGLSWCNSCPRIHDSGVKFKFSSWQSKNFGDVETSANVSFTLYFGFLLLHLNLELSIILTKCKMNLKLKHEQE